MSLSFLRLPPQGSPGAGHVDTLFFAMVAASALAVVAIVGTMLTFAIRYRRGSRADRTGAVGVNTTRIEVTWIAALTVLFLGMFAWGAMVFLRLFEMPPDALEIYVVGKQWMWQVQHPAGRREIDSLHVPIGIPVKLTMISQDVIHSLYLPGFRLKHDVLPGRYSHLAFTADRLGVYPLYCAEYCGTQHSGMIGSVTVMAPEAYEAWLQTGGTNGSLAVQGARRFQTLGCSGCHAPGSTVRAPSLAGIYGRSVPLADGSFATADDAYIRDSILVPDKQVVAGFAPIMPTFAGRVDEADLQALIAYLKSLREQEKLTP